jgi:hypothetical protein
VRFFACCGQADRYPHLGNEDNRTAAQLEQEAFAKAAHAVPPSDDPLEFGSWLATLLNSPLPNHDRKVAL